MERLSHAFVPLKTTRHTPVKLGDIFGNAGGTDVNTSKSNNSISLLFWPSIFSWFQPLNQLSFVNLSDSKKEKETNHLQPNFYPRPYPRSYPFYLSLSKIWLHPNPFSAHSDPVLSPSSTAATTLKHLLDLPWLKGNPCPWELMQSLNCFCIILHKSHTKPPARL